MNKIKTTALGVITIILAIGGAIKALIDGDPSTNVDVTILGTAVTTGWGLIVAEDAAE